MELNASRRPVFSKRLVRGDKSYWLPVPARYRELLDCVHALGIKTVEDEDDIRTMEYRSLIGVKPGNGASWFIADDIAECLAMLTPGQLDAVNRLCTEFSLHFADMDSFFDFVLKTKDLSREKFKREGIPAPKSKGDV